VTTTAIVFAMLAGCATRFEPGSANAGPRLRMQSSALAPGSGGDLVSARSLATGDILPSSAGTLQSVGMQLATPAPVSHALVYLGDGLIAEAVGYGHPFFCSQFVLKAYARAGTPRSDAGPRWVSPADLLHMREGDVGTLAAARPRRYVGHLTYTAPPIAPADAL
jgi:hypothetical protein